LYIVKQRSKQDIWRLRCSGWRVFCIDGKEERAKKVLARVSFIATKAGLDGELQALSSVNLLSGVPK
jgi:hypothetical protein